MDERKVRDKQARAERAEALLRNELLNEAFDYLDEQFTAAWKNSDVKDTDNRERVYFLSQSLAALKGYFQSVIESGKLAEAQLDDFRRRATVKKLR